MASSLMPVLGTYVKRGGGLAILHTRPFSTEQLVFHILRIHDLKLM